MLEAHLFVNFLAQATPPGPGGGYGMFIWMGLLFAGMWFLIIAPQRKMQKEHDKMVEELKNGDEIMTKGGVYGVVVNVKKDRVAVKVANNTNIEVAKPFVQQVVRKKGEPAKEEETAAEAK